jgi:hypothetical protein
MIASGAVYLSGVSMNETANAKSFQAKDERQDRDREDAGNGHGQDDPPQRLQAGRAVDDGSLLKLAGVAPEGDVPRQQARRAGRAATPAGCRDGRCAHLLLITGSART